jgi:ATP-binding cassette, subfamily C, bacterial LapB
VRLQTLPAGLMAHATASGGSLTPTRYDGIRRVLHLAGADVTPLDMDQLVGNGNAFSLERLGEVALTLSIEPRLARGRLRELTLASTLFVFECRNGELWAFAPGPRGTLVSLDLATGLAISPPSLDEYGRALVLSPANLPQASRKEHLSGWARRALKVAGRTLPATIVLTLVSNLLGLALPLFTLAVYDQVLSSKSLSTLALLVAGLAVSVVGDFLLRTLRSAMLARASAIIDIDTQATLFGRLLRSWSPFGRGSAGRFALMRLRDLDLIRGFLIGPIGYSCIEAPFAIVYLLVLALLGGWLAAVPIAILGIGGGVVFLLLGSVARRGRAALQQAEEYGAICSEVSKRLSGIKLSGHSGWYIDRFRDASGRLAEAEVVRQRSVLVTQVASSSLVSLAVLATLGAGALAALRGEISGGVLIASVALVWRISAPLPALLLARLRWSETAGSMATVGAVLDKEPDRPFPHGMGGRSRGMAGRIGFSSVLMSYQQGYTPAIRNLSIEIPGGQIVAVTGQSGSGKSTLLDLVAGIVEPQFGAVTIDGVSPRQVSPTVLRQSLGYLPQHLGALPMTVGDYLVLGLDAPSRQRCAEICARTGILGQIERLPKGLEGMMTDLDPSCGLMRGLTLTRVLAARASVLLLDEPDASSRDARHALLSEIERLRGTSTIILVTHEPEFVAAADRVLVLSQGALVRDCAPRDITRRREAAAQ